MDDPAFTEDSPGAYLHHLMAAKGWKQIDLAFVLGLRTQEVSKLLNDQRAISAELAKRLSAVLSVPAWRLLALQKNWDAKRELARAPEPPAEDMRKARVVGAYPIREMIKRGWLIDDPATIEEQMLKFFGVDSLEEVPHLAHAGKKTAYDEIPPAQLAWLFRAKRMASKQLVARYSPEAAHSAVSKLDGLLSAAEEARKVPRILMEAGIRFVLVESLPGAKIDGAALWIRDNAPAIAMSLRFDRIDNFWFVLRHELEHVIREHGRGGVDVMLDAELEGVNAGTEPSLPAEEREANEAAAAFCVPTKSMKQFLARKAPFFAERDILAFSQAIRVHPGLVAGRLQHETGRYDRFRQHQVKIRSIVAPGAMVDGWGDVAPIDG